MTHRRKPVRHRYRGRSGRFDLESLEPRILFSADLPGLVGDWQSAANTSNAEPQTVSSSLTESTAAERLASRSIELVFVDERVEDIEAVLADLDSRTDRHFEVHIIETGDDALARIGGVVGSHDSIGAMHLFSHGSEGSLQLGDRTIDTLTLLERAEAVSGWADSFIEDADILIYGCDLAADAAGLNFAETLGELTRTDVAASDDITGAGGDWQLEHQTGAIEHGIAFSDVFQVSYTGSFATYTVTNLNDSGAGSLRDAIDSANASGTDDRIEFSVAGTISLTDELPEVTDRVTIDATTAPGYAGTPVVVPDGTSADSNDSGLVLWVGSDGSEVRGLQLQNFEDGIYIQFSVGHTIAGNYIGTDGTSDAGNSRYGIYVNNSGSNTIGGSSVADRNVISGNDSGGIYISGSSATNNAVLNNYVGTNAAGSAALANNSHGIIVDNGASNNTIGGDRAAGEGNLISGNASLGLFISDAGTDDNVVSGNNIGTNAAGTATIGNGADGIYLNGGAQRTVIGGTTANAMNLISGNGDAGIEINDEGTDDTLVYGNRIGTDVSGSSAIGNARHGIVVYNAVERTLVGGAAAGEGNLISGNAVSGVVIDGGPGGSTTRDNVVAGNLIGTNASGTTSLANGADGIQLFGGAQFNTIGGAAVGAGNVLSGNGSHGVVIQGSATASNNIFGNYIGTDAAGLAALGNSGRGILLTNATGTLVGGTAVGAGNLVANNIGDGINISGASASGNALLGNLIHSNGGLGIDLGTDGVDSNDTDDVDTGANALQNTPVLSSASTDGSSTLDVVGTLDGEASQAYRIEFFSGSAADASGHGEAETYLGSVAVTTDASGDAAISTTLAVTLAAGEYVTATATVDQGGGSYGNTSEFAENAITVVETVVAATDDAVAVVENTPTAFDPTDNDTDANSDAISVVEFTDPANGSVVDNGDGTMTYTPTANYTGADSFEYLAIDAGAGLQHHWGLGGDAVDAVGGADGTVTGASTVAGAFGEALSFDEVDDVVTLPDVSYASEFTISFVFKVDDNSGNRFQYLYSHGDANNFNSVNVFINEASHGSDPNVLRTVIRDGNDSLDNFALQFDISGIVGDGQWHRYTATVGANGIEVFLNGVSQASDATRGTGGVNPTGSLRFGASYNLDASRYFGGSLETVQIFDNALSSTQISDLTSEVNLGTVNLTVSPANNAPVLDNSGTVTLTAVTEDESTNSGQTVASILATAGDPVSDVDGGPEGIAITNLDASADNGEFEYSLDGGSTWNRMGDVSSTHALLLGDTDLLRFVPRGYTSETASFDFRAWDQSSGSAGDRADASVNGGSTAFSTATETASITTTSINDTPTFGIESGFSVEDFTDSDSFDYPIDVERLVDGSTLVATIGRYNGANAWVLAKFGTYGALETNFGTNGYVVNEFGSGSDRPDAMVVQPDGKIVVAGYSFGTNSDYSVVRYNADGSLDSSFGTAGVFTLDQGGSERAYDVALQSTGNIVLVTQNGGDFSVLRLDGSDGSLDASFGLGGIATFDLGGFEGMEAITVDASDRILVAGYQGNDAAVARLTSTGVLDTSFNTTGYATTNFDGEYAQATSILVQGDGRIVIAGHSEDYTGTATDEEYGFGLARFTDAGLLDTSFGGDGVVLTTFEATVNFGNHFGRLAQQADGKLVAVGGVFLSDRAQQEITVVRYATDGTLDASFGSNGIVLLGPGHEGSWAGAVDVGSDGTIVVAGSAEFSDNSDTVLGYLDSSGTLITSYQSNVLDGTPLFIEGGAAAVLDTDVSVFDRELSQGDDFGGTSLTLERNGGANVEDVFSATGLLGALTEGGALTYDGVTIGTVTTNSGGTLHLDFNAGATGDQVNGVLRAIAYENTNGSPLGSVQIDWIFDDGNSGAQGSGGAAQATGSTTVTINRLPVITSDGGGTSAAVNVAENTTAVTTVSSTDVDAGDTATYTITGGSDSGLFTLNASTGALAFTSAPNFESPTDSDTDGVYEVEVTVTDGSGATDVQTISVTVTDDNEAPVITSDGGGTSAAVNVAENTTAVTTVTSTDVDTGDSATYTISGGADSGLFTLNSSTGDLAFTSAPNFESPTDSDTDGVYEVEVTVTDGSGATDVQTLSVTVTDDNEAPVITSDGGGTSAAVNVAENATAVTTVTSTDVDAADTATYTITGGADQGLFTLNSATGALAFSTAPNFESPTDSDTDGAYEVEVTVTDGAGATDVQTITVNVTDANDGAPTITSDGGGTTANVNVSENTTAVTTVTNTDPDISDTATYSISGGADSGFFILNASSGDLTFTTVRDYETASDSNGGNDYVVEVTVTDGAGATDVQTITVNITDTNDNVPVIDASQTFSVSEGAANSASVGTVTATDPDTTGALQNWVITAGNGDGIFAIDASTGEITVTDNTNLDYESTNQYVLTLSVGDGTNTSPSETVTIDITNVNETPTITSDGGGSTASVNVAENTTAVTTVTSIDPDSSDTASYAITGGTDASFFTLNASTGVLSFSVAQNFESPADSDANNIFEVEVTVTDGAGATDVQAIAVTVSNVHNNAPVIGVPPRIDISENGQHVASAAAYDADGNPIELTISGGADAALFRLDRVDGILSLIRSPDYEAPIDRDRNNVYEIELTATDSHGLVVTQAVAVHVGNVNESPVIDLAAAQTDTNTDFTGRIGQVAVFDPDSGARLSVQLIAGEHADTFAVDAATGEISKLRQVAAGEYTLQIVVVDEFGAETRGELLIRVLDDGKKASVLTDFGPQPEAISPPIGGGTAPVDRAENGSRPLVQSGNPGTNSADFSEPDIAVSTGDESSERGSNDGDSSTSKNRLLEVTHLFPDATQIPPSAEDGDRSTVNDPRSGGENFRGFALLLDLIVRDAQNTLGAFVSNDHEQYSLFTPEGELQPQIVAVFEEIARGFDDQQEMAEAQRQQFLQVGTVLSVSLTAGFVTWLLSTGSLLATTASTTALWKNFDPIPVLAGSEDDETQISQDPLNRHAA